MFFNIHTHQSPIENEYCIRNLHEDFDTIQSNYYYSLGLHPWYINSNQYPTDFEKLKIQSLKKNVLSIGECGLDRICNTAFKLQEDVFRQHILWANEIAKPLIIHCVKAHAECIRILKESNNIMPVIFHGFHNKWEIADQLLQKEYYLSFGKSLFDPQMEKVFTATPIERIFLETDDSNHNILEIYIKAATLRQISIDQLHSQIRKNAHLIFNTPIP